MNVERHHADQLVITHLGETSFGTAFQQLVRQADFCFNQRIDFLFNRAATNKFMYQYILFLPDAVGPVAGLVFHRRVPPTVKMDHMRGRCQI